MAKSWRALRHKVGNTLHGLAGLLELEAAEAAQAPPLQSAIRRIHVAAVAYGHATHRDGRVRLGSLLAAIVGSLRRAQSARIAYREAPRAADWLVREQDVVPLALIAGELLWNAVDRCGPAPKDRVRVGVARDGRSGVLLSVRYRPTERGAAEPLAGGGPDLARRLLPPGAGNLELKSSKGWIEAELRLAPPAVRLQGVRKGAIPRKPSSRLRNSSTRNGLVT